MPHLRVRDGAVIFYKDRGNPNGAVYINENDRGGALFNAKDRVVAPPPPSP